MQLAPSSSVPSVDTVMVMPPSVLTSHPGVGVVPAVGPFISSEPAWMAADTVKPRLFGNPSANEPRLDDASPLKSYYEALNVIDRRRRLCLPHAADDLSLTHRLDRAIAR